jgi:hypothetical protein
MEPAALIERLRAIATRVGPRDATFLRELAEVLEHRAVAPAYSQTAVDVITSFAGEVDPR